MKKLFAYVDDGTITIQERSYQDYGWHIIVDKETITLFETPFHSRNTHKIGDYKTIIEAVNAAESLT